MDGSGVRAYWLNASTMPFNAATWFTIVGVAPRGFEYPQGVELWSAVVPFSPDVRSDTAGGSLEPLNRVASGVYNIASGDINSLIKFRDANPNAPIKAIFIVHDQPPFAIIRPR